MGIRAYPQAFSVYRTLARPCVRPRRHFLSYHLPYVRLIIDRHRRVYFRSAWGRSREGINAPGDGCCGKIPRKPPPLMQNLHHLTAIPLAIRNQFAYAYGAIWSSSAGRITPPALFFYASDSRRATIELQLFQPFSRIAY